MKSATRIVSIQQHDSSRWQCDCVCGWRSTDGMRFASADAAQRAAALHLRICTLLHH